MPQQRPGRVLTKRVHVAGRFLVDGRDKGALLGRGQFSDVYRCSDVQTTEEHAIKVEVDPERKTLLRLERTLLEELEKAGMVAAPRLIDAGYDEENNVEYLVRETPHTRTCATASRGEAGAQAPPCSTRWPRTVPPAYGCIEARVRARAPFAAAADDDLAACPLPRFQVMTLMGESLYEKRRAMGVFTLPTMRALAVKMIDALEGMHTAGYVHRDVKVSLPTPAAVCSE
jgi:serine/threonine protein kinase